MPSGYAGRLPRPRPYDLFAPGGRSFPRPLCPARNLDAMDWENLLALVTAVALVGYLVHALVRPERF
jgi:K+-transporting ATPase KdpF subunit